MDQETYQKQIATKTFIVGLLNKQLTLDLDELLLQRIASAFRRYRDLYYAQPGKTINICYHFCDLLSRLYWIASGIEQPICALKGKPTLESTIKFFKTLQTDMNRDEIFSFSDIIKLIKEDEQRRKQEKANKKKVSSNKRKAKEAK